MRTIDLQNELIDWSVKNSGFQPGRTYLGLSGIGDCEQVIYDRLRNGQRASVEEQLKTRISYELEADLVDRLRALGVYSPGETISLYEGLVQGHTDGLISGREILEVKTLDLAIHFPANGVPSRRITWQVQGYMHFLKRPFTHVVYLARDNGAIFCLGVRYDAGLGAKIEAKLGHLVEAWQKATRPGCTCGRCPTANPPTYSRSFPTVKGEKQNR